MDRVSIIVPVYNIKHRLELCVNSIINQTYSSLEIILVDDGSTDGSAELCDRLQSFDNRIKVLHKQNGGLSDARNFGMSQATGDYFLFIDSDDMVHSRFCELLVKKAKQYTADVVAVDFASFYKDEELVQYQDVKDGFCEVVLEGDQVISEYLWPTHGIMLCHGLCNKIYKKEIFDGLCFDIGRLHEDVFITYKLMDRCNKLVYLNAPYYFYYQSNASSICKNYSEKNFNDEFDAMKSIQEYFQNRQTLYDDVVAFCAYHYKSMLIRPIEHNTENLKKKINYIRKWAIRNIWRSRSLSLLRKAKLYFELFLPKVFLMIKGEHNG